MAHVQSSWVAEVEKELGKKGKKLTLGPIQQAPELPTKTRTLRRHMDSRDGDSPGKLCFIKLILCDELLSS